MIPEHTTMIPELTTKDRCEDDKAKIEQVLDDLENYKDRVSPLYYKPRPVDQRSLVDLQKDLHLHSGRLSDTFIQSG